MVEKVTRSLRSERLNRAKYDRLSRIAILCGQVRADAWQRGVHGLAIPLRHPRCLDAWFFRRRGKERGESHMIRKVRM